MLICYANCEPCSLISSQLHLIVLLLQIFMKAPIENEFKQLKPLYFTIIMLLVEKC